MTKEKKQRRRQPRTVEYNFRETYSTHIEKLNTFIDRIKGSLDELKDGKFLGENETKQGTLSAKINETNLILLEMNRLLEPVRSNTNDLFNFFNNELRQEIQTRLTLEEEENFFEETDTAVEAAERILYAMSVVTDPVLKRYLKSSLNYILDEVDEQDIRSEETYVDEIIPPLENRVEHSTEIEEGLVVLYYNGEPGINRVYTTINYIGEYEISREKSREEVIKQPTAGLQALGIRRTDSEGRIVIPVVPSTENGGSTTEGVSEESDTTERNTEETESGTGESTTSTSPTPSESE